MFAKNKWMNLFANKIVPLVTIFSLLSADSFAAFFYLKDNQNIINGCPTNIEIGLNTEGSNVLAADAVLYFDVLQTSVQSLGVGSIFPMETFNKITGQKLELSGAKLPQTGAFNGDGVFGLINITPDNKATKININFSNDIINDQIIAEQGTFNNITTKVESKEFPVKDKYNTNINGGFCDPDKTPPNINFILPSNGATGVPANSNVFFSITDDRAGVNITTLAYSIKGINYTDETPPPTLAGITESSGTFRVETNPDADFIEGENVTTNVYVCDLNVPANCGSKNATFRVYTPPPPSPVCGDGLVTYQVGEQCDDGNTTNGDECSSLCIWEQPPEQFAAPAECPEPTACPVCETCEQQQPTTELQPAAGEQPIEEIPYDEFASPEIMDSIAGCTREEVTKDIMETFEVVSRYQERDNACHDNLEHCMLPFSIHTSFKDVDYEKGVYYPDIFLEKDQRDRVLLKGEGPVTQEFKNAINFGTRMGMVQGFYEDVVNLSPFRPKYNMTRAQIIKLLNWAALNQGWQYENEYWASIGGEQNWSLVKKSFNDLTEWWYPRYINSACDKGIIDCDPNTAFGPQEVCSPTWKRDIMAKYQVYYEQQKKPGQKVGFEDTDKDTLIDRDENNIFYTDYIKADTDDDGLTDGTEVETFKTSPVLPDTDNDILTDGDEINKYKTNPLNTDSDGDGFTDGLEIAAGSDPNNSNNIPTDVNGNGIDDAWEKKYGLSPISGVEDTDVDGLSDLLEYRYGTNPLNQDTDGDGLTDGDEVLLYITDPLVFNTLDDSAVRITNIVDGMTLSDLRPFILGTGPMP